MARKGRKRRGESDKRTITKERGKKEGVSHAYIIRKSDEKLLQNSQHFRFYNEKKYYEALIITFVKLKATLNI